MGVTVKSSVRPDLPLGLFGMKVVGGGIGVVAATPYTTNRLHGLPEVPRYLQ